MRASYVNREDLLTPLGEWIASRLPHVDSHKGIWQDPDSRVFRVFGLAPYYRRCIFDYTSSPRLKVFRVRIFSWTLIGR